MQEKLQTQIKNAKESLNTSTTLAFIRALIKYVKNNK